MATKPMHAYAALVEGEIDGVAFYNKFKYRRTAEKVASGTPGAKLLDLVNPGLGWEVWDEKRGNFKQWTGRKK